MKKSHYFLVKNLYICAPYNCADFPLLSEFEEMKNHMSIINKSFVTLGKPLRVYNSFVYLRDTMLLAPAGKGSLDHLGVLYKGPGGVTFLK